MSISADPLFVAAEVEWRRQILAASYPKTAQVPRHRASVIRGALGWSVLHHRDGRRRPPTARPA